MKRTLSLLAIAGLLLLDPALAAACSCMRPESPSIELAKAEAVFEGRVTALRPDETNVHMVRVTLEVLRSWKGISEETVEVTTADNSAACGFNFEEGRSYLLYAERVEGSLSVSLCSRSRDSEGAVEDFAALDAAPAAPASPVPAPYPATPIAPPPPPPEPKGAGGCAGCAMAPEAPPQSGLFALLAAVGLLWRRRVVS